MKRLFKPAALLALALFTSSLLAQQSQPKSQSAILPQVFAGWEKSNVQTGKDPAVVDPASSRVLKEYGFTDFETATYTKDDRKLTVKAARFNDASGAYGAFTFYRSPEMLTESIGTMAASANQRVLFFRENVLVIAAFDRITAMSAGELRELAQNLPAPGGPAANLPTLPNYFPRRDLVANSAKFIIGPEALAASNAPITAAQVDFSLQPEILMGKYSAGGANADFLIVEYPTPQIAGDRLRVLETANPKQDGTTFLAKRTGPFVALVKGSISERDAKSLLGRVNYEADVTWNENTGLSKRDNIGNLVIAASLLAGIIFLISVGTGAIFGFGRIVLQKLFPRLYAAHEKEAGFIELHLKD